MVSTDAESYEQSREPDSHDDADDTTDEEARQMLNERSDESGQTTASTFMEPLDENKGAHEEELSLHHDRLLADAERQEYLMPDSERAGDTSTTKGAGAEEGVDKPIKGDYTEEHDDESHVQRRSTRIRLSLSFTGSRG